MKKTFLKKAMAVSLMLCLLSALFVPISVGAATQKKSYVALGDSISAGYGLESLNDSFPTLLTAQLGSEYTLSNKAVSGDTTTDLLEHLKTADYKQAVSAADVITVTIGGNDLLAFLYKFLSEKLGMNLEQVTAALENGDFSVVVKAANAIISNDFAPNASEQAVISANHAEVVKQIKALNPDVTLVIATQYNPYAYLAAQVSELPSFLLQGDLKTLADAVVKLSETVESTIIPFNEDVKNRAATQSYLVADAYALFKNSSENLSNAAFVMSPISIELDFHPNKAGHSAIATCMKTVVSTAATPCDHSQSTSKPTCSGSAVCSICGETISALQHTSTIIPAVPATCTEQGLSEGSKCSICNITIVAQQATQANGHSGGSATCKDLAKCGVCGSEYGELDPDHTKYMLEETLHDESKHWNACLCNTTFNVNEHTFDSSGSCTGCGYKKAVTTTEVTTTNNSETESTDIVTPPAGEVDDQPTDEKSCTGMGGIFAAVAVIISLFGTALVKNN